MAQASLSNRGNKSGFIVSSGVERDLCVAQAAFALRALSNLGW